MTIYDNVRNQTTDEYFQDNQFGIDVVNAKYSKIKDDGSKESIVDIFNRISTELSKFEIDSEQVRNKWFDLMYNDWFRPGGSIIAGIGSKKKESLANCFAEETEFQTKDGLKSFKDFNHGDVVDVLIPSNQFKTQGDWYRPAMVKEFGEQELFQIVFRRKTQRYIVRCTKDHKWLLGVCLNKNITLTKDLKGSTGTYVGDMIKSVGTTTHNPVDWYIESVTKLNVTETVWCIQEPVNNIFVLDHMIPTHNCSTLPIEDDTLEAIAETYYNLMKCASYRQGIGIDLSKLRPKGSKVMNAAEQSLGIVPWGKKYSSIGDYIGQASRQPAILLSLDCSHPDIVDFINSKLELGQIEFANISVQISEHFMECVKNDKDWTLRFETEHEKIVEIVKARELFHLISETANKSAEPGVQFIDLMRQGSMVNAVYEATGDEKYRIVSTNACSEKPLAPYGVCVLGSLNMENFSVKTLAFRKQLEEIVPSIVRLMDNVVEYELVNNRSPIPQQRELLEDTREIGLGITNLHGWFLKAGLQYDSDEAIDLINNFYSFYAYLALKESIKIGKEKGNCLAFDKVTAKDLYDNSIFVKNVIDTWYSGDYTVLRYLRNLAIMSIAPSGSISATFSKGCMSSGVEPIIAPYYWRKTKAISKGEYDYYFVVIDAVKKYVLEQITDKDSEDYKTISNSGSDMDNSGEIGLKVVEVINKYLTDGFFKPAHEIDYNKKLLLLSKLYKWTDASISCTFNLPNSSTTQDVENIYLSAYDLGVRAVSVYREGSREGILIFDDPKSHQSKEQKRNVLCQTRPDFIEYHCAPKRPRNLDCDVHHINVRGVKWLVLIGKLNNTAYEIFAGMKEDLYLPKSVTTGSIEKKGGGTYALNVKIRGNEVQYKSIADVLMTSEQKAITRMISVSLRHGVPTEFIEEQIKKSKNDITDFSSAVSRILSKYRTNIVITKDICPQCNEPMVKTGGCKQCMNCNFSACE